MLGGFLALLSAATFAFETATARRGVLTGSVAQALSITVPLGVPIFFLVAAAFGALGTVLGFSAEAFAYLALAGVLHFVWGRYCNYRASKAMGANLVAPVQQGNLLVTLALAIWILGEHLTPLRVLGIVLVVLGPALTYDRTRRKSLGHDRGRADRNRRAQSVPPNYAEGYLFALLSSTGYGISPVLVRLALENRSLEASLGGGLISYTAATLAFALILLLPGQWRHVRSIDPRRGEMVRDLRRLRLLRADAPLHGAGARAGVGGHADPAHLAAVPALFQPHHQSAARGVRRTHRRGDCRVAPGRAGAVGQHGDRAVGAAVAGLGQDVPQLALAVTVGN